MERVVLAALVGVLGTSLFPSERLTPSRPALRTTGLGRPVEVQSGGGADRGLHVQTEYDGLGRVTTRTDVDTGTTDTYAYGDALGRMTYHQRQVPSGAQMLSLTETVSYASTGTGQAITTVSTADDGLGTQRSKTVVVTLDAAGRTLATQETVPTLDTDGNASTATKLDTYTYDAQGRQLTHTDATGHTWTNTYDPMGRLLATTDPSTAQVTFVHDSAGNVTDQVGPLTGQGQHLGFGYDPFNQLITKTEAGAPGQPGATWSYSYPGTGSVSITAPVGVQTTRAYNGRYKTMVETMTDNVSGNTRTTSYQYDGPWVEQRQITEGSWQATLSRPSTPGDYGFDDQGRVLHEVEGWSGTDGTAYSYDTRTSWQRQGATTRRANVVAEAWTLGAGAITPGDISSQLDGLGNVVGRQQGDVSDRWLYGADGQLSQEQLGNTTPTTNRYLEGRVTSRVLGYGLPSPCDVGDSLLADGGTAESLLADGGTGSPSGLCADGGWDAGYPSEETDFGYDPNGHEVLRLDPLTGDGRRRYKASSYDERQLLATEDYGFNGDATHATYTYDADGNRQSAQEGLSAPATTVYGYGNSHELTSVALPGMPDGFAYVYDANRRLIGITPPSGIPGYSAPSQTFRYDYQNRLVKRTRGPAASWTTQYQDGEATTTDADGNQQVTMTDGKGRTTYQGFRPGATTVSGLSSATYGYDGKDQLALQVEARDDGSDGGTVTAYAYDERSRLTAETRTSPDGGADSVSFAYQPASDLMAEVSTQAGSTLYSYDLLSRVSTVSGTGVTWEAGGQRVVALSNPGEVETRCYDNRGRVAQLIHAPTLADCQSAPPSGVVASFAYTYDDRDNRQSETYQDPFLNEVTTYSVDAADRLTGVVYPAGWGAFYEVAEDGTRTAEVQVVQPLATSVDYASAAGLGAEYDYRYSYEQGGALTGITQNIPNADGGNATALPAAIYGVDLEGRRQSEFHPTLTFGQQMEGSALSGYGWNYTWDASNQVVSAQQTQLGGLTYQYQNDGLGMRRSATQVDSFGNQVTSHYVYGRGQLYAEVSPTGINHYDRLGSIVTAIGGDPVLHDSLNSAVGLITGNGPVLYRYDAQGAFRVNGGSYTEPVFGNATAAFAGGNSSAAEPGVRLGERTYDGFSGTWYSPDPRLLGSGIMYPQGMGAFTYASSNAVRWTDPTGRDCLSDPSPLTQAACSGEDAQVVQAKLRQQAAENSLRNGAANDIPAANDAPAEGPGLFARLGTAIAGSTLGVAVGNQMNRWQARRQLRDENADANRSNYSNLLTLCREGNLWACTMAREMWGRGLNELGGLGAPPDTEPLIDKPSPQAVAVAGKQPAKDALVTNVSERTASRIRRSQELLQVAADAAGINLGFAKGLATITVTENNGTGERLVTVKSPSGNEWRAEMVTAIRASLAPGEIWAGDDTSLHAEIQGQAAAISRGWESVSQGSSNPACPTCQVATDIHQEALGIEVSLDNRVPTESIENYTPYTSDEQPAENGKP